LSLKVTYWNSQHNEINICTGKTFIQNSFMYLHSSF
jgi:hypothetical protein